MVKGRRVNNVGVSVLIVICTEVTMRCDGWGWWTKGWREMERRKDGWRHMYVEDSKHD